MDTTQSRSFSFRKLFFMLTLAFTALLTATALQAWTGPTATAPAGNIAAPVNVGTTDQVKSAGLSLDALAVFGSQYIDEKLGIGRVSPVVALDVNGSVRIANGGEVCQSVTEGGVRYNSSSHALEYCNGTAWGPLATGATGPAGPAGPQGPAGPSPVIQWGAQFWVDYTGYPNSSGRQYGNACPSGSVMVGGEITNYAMWGPDEINVLCQWIY